MNLISLFASTLIIENIVLTKFLGLSLFLEKPNRNKKMLIISVFLTIISLLSTISIYLLNKYIFIPNNITYLQIVLIVVVISIFIKLGELIIKKFLNKYYELFKECLPYIITNTLMIGIILISINLEYNLITSIIYSLGCSLGFIIVTIILEENVFVIRNNKVLKSFKGLPIELVIIGIMALIFSRL